MIKLLKSEEGFTLMEAIISIATLAIVSGFILQMFIVSNNVNKKAQDIDIGNTFAMNTIELFKSETSLEDYIVEDFFAGCYIDSDEAGTVIYRCYNDEWEQVYVEDSVFDLENIPSDVAYVLNVMIGTDGAKGSNTYVLADTEGGSVKTLGTGCMYTINTTVNKYEKINQVNQSKELVNLSAAKYFAN